MLSIKYLNCVFFLDFFWIQRIQSNGVTQARALGAAVESNIEHAVANLMQASNAVAATLELTKNYIKEKQGILAYKLN